MQVLVTGGAGFIGSHLCEALVARGERVLVLDDLSTGRLENLEPLLACGALELCVGSVTDAARVAELVGRVDVVYHLAAAVGVRLVVARPVQTIETNVLGTEAVLRAAARRRTPVFFASSSEVYGAGERLPFHEDDDLQLGASTCSRWSYACSKAQGEWLALAYHRERGLPVAIARFFNTAGPRQTGRYGMVLPTFAGQALGGAPITVHGSGEQTRCFCHVRDTVEAVLRLGEHLRAPHVDGRIFNIGTDREVSIGELALLVRAHAKSASPIVRVEYADVFGNGFEDLERRVPDVSRLERATGFRARTPLERIVADVVAEQRARVAV